MLDYFGCHERNSNCCHGSAADKSTSFRHFHDGRGKGGGVQSEVLVSGTPLASKRTGIGYNLQIYYILRMKLEKMSKVFKLEIPLLLIVITETSDLMVNCNV